MNPSLSIVTASVTRPPAVAELLASLERQLGGHSAEVIVVTARADGADRFVAEQYPNVKVLRLKERSSIPAYWAAGIAHAEADIVAITEDHCIAADTWYDEILKAHERGYDVVGGAVENLCVDRLTDWAVFLSEYGHAMSPIPNGEVVRVTGNNVAYRRKALDAVLGAFEDGCWEYFVHDDLRARGARFLSAPSMVVYHKKRFGFFYALSQRFHYSRSFAAARRDRVAPWRRLAYGLAAPILPLQLVARTARVVASKRRNRREFLLSSPILCALGVSHAAGELAGYLMGPGDSPARVE